MAKRKRDLRLQARWRGLVKRQASSGLSVRAFCRQEGVTESAYYAWRRELRLREREQVGTPAFVPVTLAEQGVLAQQEQIVIQLRGERVLRVPMALPAARVTELVQAVEAAS